MHARTYARIKGRCASWFQIILHHYIRVYIHAHIFMHAYTLPHHPRRCIVFQKFESVMRRISCIRSACDSSAIAKKKKWRFWDSSMIVCTQPFQTLHTTHLPRYKLLRPSDWPKNARLIYIHLNTLLRTYAQRQLVVCVMQFEYNSGIISSCWGYGLWSIWE